MQQTCLHDKTGNHDMTNIEIISECLGQIDPAALQYDEWLQIGSAIKHEGGDVSIWDSWSRSDKRYRPNDCLSRWDGLDKGRDSVTVATVVKLCKDHGGTPPKPVPDESEMNAEIPMDRPIYYYNPIMDQPKKEPEKIIRKEWLEIEPLPPPTGKTGPQELAEYIRTLFGNDEYIGYVATAFQSEPDADGKRKWLPGGKGVFTTTAGEILNDLAACDGDLGMVIGDIEPECGAWIRFNPLNGKGVSDACVTDYRFALVESDEIGINEQYTIYRKLELPIAALVHSGSKSLHAIVRIEAADYKEYQQRVDFLYEICKKNGLEIDRKNRNPSRLSRMPGVDRKGVRQRLVATNIGKSSWNEWTDWIAAQNDDLPEVECLDQVWDHLPELADCLIDGVLRQGHKMLVSGPSKAGKSFLLLELAIAIAEGHQWLGWPCRQGRVLYVNLELDRASCLHRLKDIYQAEGITKPTISNIDVWNLRGKSLPMNELAPRLIRRAMKRKYSAVIIDPIYKVITGDENSADQMAKFCNQFDKICSELKCSVIYCHHHSKGDQGQKRAQDRASGSGVFARDPDALIDMVELEIDDKRRAEIKYKFQVRNLQRFLDRITPGWKNNLDMEDAEKLEVLIELARKASPDADKVNGAEIYAAEKMTGWRIGGILREFPAFDDRHAFFRYPVHISGDEVDTLLQDALAIGAESPYMVKMSPADFKLFQDFKKSKRKEAGKEAGKQKQNETINKTRLAFAALDDGQPVTTKRIAEYLDIDERNARKRLHKAGYVTPEGAKGLWVEPKGETDADEAL